MDDRAIQIATECFIMVLQCMFIFQVIQYQTVKYEVIPLSPLSKHRLSEYLSHSLSVSTVHFDIYIYTTQ